MGILLCGGSSVFRNLYQQPNSKSMQYSKSTKKNPAIKISLKNYFNIQYGRIFKN